MNYKKIFCIISFVFSILTLGIGIIILPSVSNIGVLVLQYILAVLILSYVFFVLLYKAIKRTNANQILAIIEIVLDLVIALTLILNFKLNFIIFNDLFYVIMLVIFIHTFFSILGGYFAVKNSPKAYPIYLLLIDVCLLIFSVLGFANPIFDNVQLIIVTSICCFLCSLFSLIMGIILIKKSKKIKELI